MPQRHANLFSRKGIMLLCGAGIVLFALLWLWIASASAQDQAIDEGQPSRGTPVRLITLEIEDEILVQRRFLGRLEAWQTSEIGFEFGGTIDMIDVSEGARVKKGDLLASQRIDALLLERAALDANLQAVQSQFDFAQEQQTKIAELVRRRVAPAAQLDEIEAERNLLAARLTEVKTQAEQLELRIDAARLFAPFDGIVGATNASTGETVGPGQPIVTIFESGGGDLRVGLPTSLNPTDILNPQIDLNGQTYEVTFRAVRPDIDFRTNTRVAIFRVKAQDLDSFGLSATLRGEVALPLRGAWVPVEAMRPSSEGYWIVLAVDDEMVAESVAVEVQYLRADEAYVIGAFDTGTNIIGTGAHKVVPGQTVRAE